MTSAFGSYTAMLTDGPLEGKTVTTDFLEGGQPQPRLELPGGKRTYVYVRAAGVEFSDEARVAATDGDTPLPSAVSYRYLGS